jgi:hypothetical protein
MRKVFSAVECLFVFLDKTLAQRVFGKNNARQLVSMAIFA